MAHTCVSALFHIVFGTKDRRPMISPPLQQPLWAYLGGIARKNGMKALAIGGTADHVHILLSIPAIMPIAKAVQLLKGGSSKWIHDTFPEKRLFSWQESYGAFSVSVSHVEETVSYIQNQQKHHSKKSFKDEFLAFLTKHKMEFDEQYLWG